MRVSQCVGCEAFPCGDVNHDCYVVPHIDVNPDAISIVVVSEAAPADPDDYYYADGDPLFQGKRAFPSYLQAGPSFFIEKSKRKMIAEDIASALSLVR